MPIPAFDENGRGYCAEMPWNDTRYCGICGKPAMKTPHHIMTRGAHGPAALIPVNEYPLCLSHHSEAHTLGRKTWARKYGLEERVESAEAEVRAASRIRG